VLSQNVSCPRNGAIPATYESPPSHPAVEAIRFASFEQEGAGHHGLLIYRCNRVIGNANGYSPP